MVGVASTLSVAVRRPRSALPGCGAARVPVSDDHRHRAFRGCAGPRLIRDRKLHLDVARLPFRRLAGFRLPGACSAVRLAPAMLRVSGPATTAIDAIASVCLTMRAPRVPLTDAVATA